MVKHTATSVVTIERFIIEQEKLHPEATGELSGLLYDLALAAKMIANKVRSAGLADTKRPAPRKVRAAESRCWRATCRSSRCRRCSRSCQRRSMFSRIRCSPWRSRWRRARRARGGREQCGIFSWDDFFEFDLVVSNDAVRPVGAAVAEAAGRSAPGRFPPSEPSAGTRPDLEG